MASFYFNPADSFEENLDSFLQHMANEDAELGSVLRAEASRLKGAVDDSRRRIARTDFNEAVKIALDKMLSASKEGGGK